MDAIKAKRPSSNFLIMIVLMLVTTARYYCWSNHINLPTSTVSKTVVSEGYYDANADDNDDNIGDNGNYEDDGDDGDDDDGDDDDDDDDDEKGNDNFDAISVATKEGSDRVEAVRGDVEDSEQDVEKKPDHNQFYNEAKEQYSVSDDIIPWDVDNLHMIIDVELDKIQRVQLANDIVGEVLPNKQLVVNFVNRTDHLLCSKWHQMDLCNLLQSMALIDTLPSTQHVDMPKRPLLNITLDCIGMSKDPRLGQGNWVTAIYTARITAAAARVDFQFQCYEGRDSEMTTLLPWVEVYQPAPTEDNPWPYKGQVPTNYENCNKYKYQRIDYMIDEIMNDMQRMGVTILGSRPGKTHPDVPEDQPPLVPDVEVEDVVIHFRCGDIFGDVDRNAFGIMKFKEYKKHISTNAKSVGIVTQPFTAEGNRPIDVPKIESCKKAVYLMVEYLQDYLPSAKISIHNDQDESLPLTYARLVMADQSFTTLSSFGIYPVIGGFGKGYFQKGNRGVNQFNIYLPSIYPEKLHMMDAEILTSLQISRKKDVNEVLEWLVEE